LEKQYVRDLADKESVHSVFLVREKSLHTGKSGKAYLSVSLSDKTGHMDGRIWDNAVNWDEQFSADDFVLVKGTIQFFQNRRQCVVHSVEVIESFGVDLKDFLPTSARPPEEMMTELMGIVANVQNSFLRQLLEKTLTDGEIRPLFMAAPAAKTIHHAYLGGLLEHVLSICGIMKFLAEHYPFLDRDLLIFGAIYHDIGKIWELRFDTSIGYTDVGRWVGHIPLGSELIEKKAAEISNFPFELKNICKHITLSHHGKLEYGSPKLPSILEAVVVGYIDDLDSKVNSIFGMMKSDFEAAGENPDRWSKFSPLYERHFFIGHMGNVLSRLKG
jgi:3'-5' exoribonuclease